MNITETCAENLISSPNKSEVIFEPGAHAIFPWDYIPLRDAFDRGDLSRFNTWGDKVLARIKETQPFLITADTLSSLFPLTLNEKIETWARGLPGDPAEIHPIDKKVYVMRGDLLIEHLADTPLGEQLGREKIETVESQQRAISSIQGYAEPLIIGMVGNLVLNVLNKSILEALKTRRGFLKAAALMSLSPLLYPLIPIGTQFAASYSGSQRDKEFYLEIADLLRPRFIKSEYTNWRTAIVMAKHCDALDFLNRGEPSTILMGTGHTSEAKQIIRDEAYRRNIIAQYTKTLIDIINHLVETHNKNQFSIKVDPNYARTVLLDSISSFDLVEVKSPQLLGYNSRNIAGGKEQMWHVIDQVIQPASQVIKSKRVEEALGQFKK